MMLADKFLQQNKTMKRSIIQNVRQYQNDRLEKMKTLRNLSKRIQKAAQNNCIGISPQVKLPVKASGDTIEDNQNNIDLADINFLSTTEDDNVDEFHDAPTSNNI